jgi:multiple sugar transport system permease protein
LYTYIPSLFVEHVTFDRYLAIFTGREEYIASPGQIVGGETLRSFRYGLFNSLIVSSMVTIICLLIGALAAYPYSQSIKFKFRGSKILFALMMFFRTIPVAVLVIPLYLLIRNLGLYDTKFGLILMYTSFSLPLIFLLMKSFFDTIPSEIIDAARIDGCNEANIFFKILLPLSTPGLVASGLLAFIMAYQEFLFALVCTSSLNSKTISVVMAEFFGRQGMDYGMLSTGAILGVIPTLIIALVAQKYIIAGLTMGAKKG